MSIEFVETKIMLAALNKDREGVRARIKDMYDYEIQGLDAALDLISEEIGAERHFRKERKEFERV